MDGGCFCPSNLSAATLNQPLVLTVEPVNIAARATMERKGPSPQKHLVCEKERKRNFENKTCLS